MGIAIAKALFIMYFFMHLKASPALTRLVAYAGIVWLSILFTFALSDYLSRHSASASWYMAAESSGSSGCDQALV